MNERYLQHLATGSFAVDTEGEITQKDMLVAQRSGSRRTARTESRTIPARPRRADSHRPRRAAADSAGTHRDGHGHTPRARSARCRMHAPAPAAHLAGYHPQPPPAGP
ncbi:hypothetical protein GCM10010238_10610 [Streptomyces griseoviridis]|uniref:Uncharacterized protein n=1 Tax=Streptomyces griseoviridis TaxID=45398 RepID=A0A918LA73_STRGD|nr:hypothetical protein GCM10010238_10610 [Streptomyces niveoruber]